MADIMETVAELRRLEAEATVGEWRHGPESHDVSGPVTWRDGDGDWCPKGFRLTCRGASCGDHSADAALIVAMRNALPALLDYIENSERSYDYAAKSWAEERARLNERIAKLEADRG